MSAPPELKATLTLPQTDFPMKANLPQNEPTRLAAWTGNRLYEQIRRARKGAPSYILHDGPPYANGPIHLGHALNKCTEGLRRQDRRPWPASMRPTFPAGTATVCPSKSRSTSSSAAKSSRWTAIAVRRACREYAQKYVDLQRIQFERIGVFGRWDDPYLTMSNQYEASIAETFYEFFEKGFVYKGLKPVYWCIHDRTALAEAEVEYDMHTSPSIYVRYALTSDPAAIDAALAGKSVYTIIWTTTPWTLPASLAIAFHPDFEYVALEHGWARLHRRRSTRSRCARRLPT